MFYRPFLQSQLIITFVSNFSTDFSDSTTSYSTLHGSKKKPDIFERLNQIPHSLGVAYRGSSLVCYSVTYLEYKSACLVVYAITLWHISDIRELAMEFLLLTENYISKATLKAKIQRYIPITFDQIAPFQTRKI